ncbi:MAG TPA: N-methyl-L-tryptophan oxidase [Gemmatimonadaceae bacterium]|nr:N-methyl-L-tryptophan oxidase [Gemmatimonadaceae bacterium]
MKYDVAVVGLGAMGSAAAWALARRGISVIAFDQFAPPHRLGSTHGHSRIIREAYYEHPLYVPLVRRAYQLWEELEHESGQHLLLRTGGLMIGPEHGSLVEGATTSARTHGIAHELLDAPELARRFPAFRSQSDWVALYEQRAGILFPERCVMAFIDGARSHGAELHLDERVDGWTSQGDGVRLRTARGHHDADRVIVAGGAWLPLLSASIESVLPLDIERQLSHWFAPARSPGQFAPERCPIALWETKTDDLFATFPDTGHGVKCGTHHAGATTTANTVDRAVTAGENEGARTLLAQVMPDAAGTPLEARVCLYTNTPDRHFIIDWDAGNRVLLLSPCSGHGFKFASAIGEIAAQLAIDSRSWIDLAPFSLSRFR